MHNLYARLDAYDASKTQLRESQPCVDLCSRYVACAVIAVIASNAQRFTFGIVGCLECGFLEDPDASTLI